MVLMANSNKCRYILFVGKFSCIVGYNSVVDKLAVNVIVLNSTGNYALRWDELLDLILNLGYTKLFSYIPSTLCYKAYCVIIDIGTHIWSNTRFVCRAGRKVLNIQKSERSHTNIPYRITAGLLCHNLFINSGALGQTAVVIVRASERGSDRVRALRSPAAFPRTRYSQPQWCVRYVGQTPPRINL